MSRAHNKFSPFQMPEVVAGADPAANTEISDAVPAGELWELYAVSVSLVQGATQTPQPILKITDPNGKVIFQSYGATGVQAVSTTCQYTWAPGLTLSALVGATTNVNGVAPLPYGLMLPAGSTIATNTVGIGANSNYGAPSYYVIKGTS